MLIGLEFTHLYHVLFRLAGLGPGDYVFDRLLAI